MKSIDPDLIATMVIVITVLLILIFVFHTSDYETCAQLIPEDWSPTNQNFESYMDYCLSHNK